MKNILAAVLLSSVFLMSAVAKKEGNPFVGRWDITITPKANPDNPPKNPAQLQPYPDWMEVTEHDGTLTARMVGRSGMITFITEDFESQYRKWSERGVKFSATEKVSVDVERLPRIAP